MRMDVTEKELVAMVLAGRKEAFEPLVLPYRRMLLALASRMTGNREDAREVAQEALLRAFKSLRRYDPSRSFRNWLLQIAANAARDRRRRIRRDSAIIEEAVLNLPGSVDPEKACEYREIRSGLADCLTVLSPREQDVFILRDLEDLSIKETAAALGCSGVSVRVNLSSARRKVRDEIRKRHPHLEDRR